MLYGRHEEQRRIAGLDQGQVLVIRGEAGAGKSALLRDIRGSRVVAIRGVESEAGLAFGGLHQLLTPFACLIDRLPGPQARALRVALGTAEGEVTDLAVCAATLRLLGDAAAAEPLLITVDDAHDLDPASLLVLLFCCRRLAGTRLTIVLTVRDPAPRPVAVDDLPGLSLSGLAAEPAHALLAARGWPHGPALAAAAVLATGGNPLALVELARHDSPTSLLRALSTNTVPVENTLRELFGSRLRSLTAPARTALLVAAAAEPGRPEVITGAGARLGLSDGVWTSTELAGLLRLDEDGISLPHPLIRSVGYLAEPGERRRAHAAIADELVARHEPLRARWHRALAAAEPDTTLAAELEHDAAAVERRGGVASAAAVLYQAARLSNRPEDRARRRALAAHAAWKSGSVALARELLAGEPAQHGAVRVRALVEFCSGDQDAAFGFLRRAAGGAPTPDAAAELRFMAAGAAMHAGRVDDAVATAELIAEQHDDPAYRRYGRWLAAAFAGRLIDPEAEPWRVFAAAPAAISRSGAHRWLFPIVVAVHGDHPAQAREVCLAAHAELSDTGMLAMVAMPLAWLSEIEFRLGRWTDATTHATEGLRIATDVHQPPRIADFHALLAHLAAHRGEEPGARRHAEAALDLAQQTGNRLAAARATWALGSLHLAGGDHEQARRHLTMLTGFPRSHQHIARLAVSDTIEAQVRAGDAEAATATLNDFANWTTGGAPAWTRGHLHRCTALLADGQAADKAYQLSLAAETAPFDQARTALLHGQWLRRERRITEAGGPLLLAADLFDGLGARRWADQAAGELRACGGQQVGRAQRAANTLTEQETRVAELAAAGLSNREIGARLYLSHRTVGYHLHKIFPKLGITSRSQLRQLSR